MEQIRLASPGPVARHLNKRISLPISKVLARLGVHPNFITFLNMILGFSTGIVAAHGTFHTYLWAGILFQMASIFDGCDGEVAKLTNKTSKLGEWLDSISDNGALISLFTGLMIAYAKNHRYFLTGLIASMLVLGMAGLFFQMIAFLKENSRSASLVTFDKEYLSKLPLKDGSPLMTLVRYGRVLMRKDCFSLMFMISAIFGVLPTWIYIVAIGTVGANIVLLWIKIKES